MGDWQISDSVIRFNHLHQLKMKHPFLNQPQTAKKVQLPRAAILVVCAVMLILSACSSTRPLVGTIGDKQTVPSAPAGWAPAPAPSPVTADAPAPVPYVPIRPAPVPRPPEIHISAIQIPDPSPILETPATRISSALAQAGAAIERGDLRLAKNLYTRLTCNQSNLGDDELPKSKAQAHLSFPILECALGWNGLGVVHRMLGAFDSAEFAYLRALKVLSVLRFEPKVVIDRQTDISLRARIDTDQLSIERTVSTSRLRRVPPALINTPLIDLKTDAQIELDRHIRINEGIVRNNLGVLYRQFGALAAAHSEYSQSRNLMDAKLDKEAPVLRFNLGVYYNQIGRFDDAERLFGQLLKDSSLTAGLFLITQRQLSGLMANTGRLNVALNLAESSQQQVQKAKGEFHSDTVLSSINLGWLRHLNREHKAGEILSRAWTLAQVQEDENVALAADMAWSHYLRDAGKTEGAVWLARRAVNRMESQRKQRSRLAAKTQGYPLANGEDVYRHLATLLFAQGRISVAEKVLGRLKNYQTELEVSQSNKPSNLQFSESAVGNPTSAAVQGNLAPLKPLVGRIRELESRVLLNANEKSLLEKLRRELKTQQQAIYAILNVGKPVVSAGEMPKRILTEQSSLKTLQTKQHAKTLAVYTITEEQSLTLVLLVDGEISAYVPVPIQRHELAKLVEELRTALTKINEQRQPAIDPRPAAQALYGKVFAPIEETVRAQNVTTILWSVDGPLRSVPMAALHDGKRYLVERYSLGLITPDSVRAMLVRAPKPAAVNPSLGLGVTEAIGKATPLPLVETELNAIFRGPKQGGGLFSPATGVIPGEVMLNRFFTMEQMANALRVPRRVVHIATHFDAQSTPLAPSLLTFDRWVSTREINDAKKLFSQIELVTLASCDTAFVKDDSATAQHIGSLATIIQRQGVPSVIGSLWTLSGNASSVMMPKFYAYRFVDKMPLAQALQKAQLDMLLPGRQSSMAGSARFSHPFYWASMVISGDWR